MKRYLATQLAHNQADLTVLDSKITGDKTKFEDTTEYKTLSKNLDNAQKTYDQSLTDTKLDELVYLELLEVARLAFNDLLATQIVVKYEDSLEICPQLKQRVIFVKDYHEVDLLEMEVIKIEKPFFIDTGSEYITITKDNFKDYDKIDILKEKTDKYNLEQ